MAEPPPRLTCLTGGNDHAQTGDLYSEGVKLAGDLYVPEDLASGERRAGVVLCHGYTGVRNIYLPDNARVLNEAGYVVLNFDYKGWGDSDRRAGLRHTAGSLMSKRR